MIEDYRAGLGIDRRHEEQDRAAGRRVNCPAPVLDSRYDDLRELYPDLDEIWAAWTTDLTIATIDSGHHMAEEAPEQLADTISAFLA